MVPAIKPLMAATTVSSSSAESDVALLVALDASLINVLVSSVSAPVNEASWVAPTPPAKEVSATT